jgi:hypothetical protein
MKNAANVPLLVGHGIMEQQKVAYFIMKKYHKNLGSYLKEN